MFECLREVVSDAFEFGRLSPLFFEVLVLLCCSLFRSIVLFD